MRRGQVVKHFNEIILARNEVGYRILGGEKRAFEVLFQATTKHSLVRIIVTFVRIRVVIDTESLTEPANSPSRTENSSYNANLNSKCESIPPALANFTAQNQRTSSNNTKPVYTITEIKKVSENVQIQSVKLHSHSLVCIRSSAWVRVVRRYYLPFSPIV